MEERLLTLARPLGDAVGRVGDTLGQIRRKNGDVLITIAPEAVKGRIDVKIVVEAKRRGQAAQNFSANEITDSLNVARRNRGATAGLFVTVGLAVAYRLLRFAVVQEARGSAGEQIDRDAHKRVVADIRSAIAKLETIRAQHQSAINSINRASSAVTELNDAVIRGLRQLDELMEV